MKTACLILIGIAVVALGIFLTGDEQYVREDLQYEVLVENLDTPWAIDFLPDRRMIFTERPGRLSIFDGVDTKVIAQINTTEEAESGLLGIAVDPEFDENNFIYLYYTYRVGESLSNRVSRFVLIDDRISGETVIFDSIPGERSHDGGRIKFGPDGKLYATTGDAADPSHAQDVNSVAGKILRMNKDGSVPDDNPFGNYVWSYGHRNPQGLAWDEDTMYSAEHGPTRNDEVNVIEKGENYGWPNECTSAGDWKNPIRCFTEFTMAPSGIAFHDGSIYVAGLRGTQLRRLALDGDRVSSEEVVLDGIGRVREVVSHGGCLYVATSNRDGRGVPAPNDDRIFRLC